jgi:nucleoside 2-deoxyribosyltransferase
MAKRIFLAGVIQGSHRDKTIHEQDYRGRLKSIIDRHWPEAVVYDPFDGHENSVEYDDETGQKTFNGSLEKIGKCDLVIAYLPVASLGTAIEIWESFKKKIPVWTITDMKENWVVRFCSERVFEDIDALEEYLRKPVAVESKEE